MKTQTQTQTQTQKTKTSQAAKVAQVPFFAQLLVDALAGKFGPFAARYYANALAYHRKQKTTFPRPVTATARAALTMEDVKDVIAQATKGILAAGSRKGQAVFDLMMISADKGAVKAK